MRTFKLFFHFITWKFFEQKIKVIFNSRMKIQFLISKYILKFRIIPIQSYIFLNNLKNKINCIFNHCGFFVP